MRLNFSLFLLNIFAIILVRSQPDPDAIVDQINDVRRGVSPTGSDIREVEWDQCLADTARTYVNTCPTLETKDPNLQENTADCLPDGASAGQTVFFSEANDEITAEQIIGRWSSESQFYDYAQNRCVGPPGACDNYKQLVNAETYLVGCAQIDDVNCGGSGTRVICNYISPPGSDRPYTAGEPCADCEGEWESCEEGLCTRTVVTTPVATTPVATTPVATTPVETTPVATTPVATTPVITTTAPVPETTSSGPSTDPTEPCVETPHNHHGHGKHNHKKGPKSHGRGHNKGPNSHDHGEHEGTDSHDHTHCHTEEPNSHRHHHKGPNSPGRGHNKGPNSDGPKKCKDSDCEKEGSHDHNKGHKSHDHNHGSSHDHSHKHGNKTGTFGAEPITKSDATSNTSIGILLLLMVATFIVSLF